MKRILLALCISIFCFSADLKAEVVQAIEVDMAKLRWEVRPQISFINADINDDNRIISVEFEADTNGVITSAKIVQSSGSKDFDNKILSSFQIAKTKPYYQNGVAHPIRAVQVFFLRPSGMGRYENK